MKKTILITTLFCVTILFAQEQSAEYQMLIQEISVLKQRLNDQQSVINQQNLDLENLVTKTENYEKLNDSLKSEINKNILSIQSISDNLNSKILHTELTAKDNISKLGKDVNTNRLYWIIATLFTFLLGGIIYWLLGKRIINSKTDIESQIKNTKKSLEEESIKLDSKLMEVLESQMKLKKEEKQIISTSPTNVIDHSLALKVADEIIRIQKNLQQMDSNTKGLKQLSASVKRIQDNFASNGYELVEMLGKEYNEGMKVIANFILSENLESGKQVITRIIKPQVNYKNEMIQSAQIEVSVGE